MGLFSKKEYTCEMCGKTFYKRVNLNGNICDECYKQVEEEKAKLSRTISGYVDWRRDFSLLSEEYTPEAMKKIITHRDGILQKYKLEDGITTQELMEAGTNYKNFSEEEVVSFLNRIPQSLLQNTIGACYSNTFFVPTYYDGVIVETQDVFAVAMMTDHKYKDTSREGILCAVFTNDPYIPAFAIEFSGKKGLFEVLKSKGARNELVEMFAEMCPNLTYPVCDIKELKKQLKQDGMVKGNPDMETMTKLLDDLYYHSGIFNVGRMEERLSDTSRRMLSKIGYVEESAIFEKLELDKKGSFWTRKLIEYKGER